MDYPMDVRQFSGRYSRNLLMLILLAASVYLLSVLVSGCRHEVPEPISVAVPSDSCSENITYSSNIQRIMNTYCAIAGCHIAAGFKDFTSYGLLRDAITNSGTQYFLSRIEEGGGMPPDYSIGPTMLTECDYQKLESWLTSGYPE
jgi:hypothetical protein